jgi:CDGSH-type Zn-finger protein
VTPTGQRFKEIIWGSHASVQREDVVIVPYRDGPYLVRGPVGLRDQDDRHIELTRRTVALCRCGKSSMRPFCDGTHRLVGFRAPSEAERPRLASAAVDSGRPAGAAYGSRALDGDRAEGAHRLAQAKLLRARANAESLLAGSAAAESRVALRTAQSLIVGALILLAESVGQPELVDTGPCLCLVREALAGLKSLSAGSERSVEQVVALLAGVVTSLEREDG